MKKLILLLMVVTWTFSSADAQERCVTELQMLDYFTATYNATLIGRIGGDQVDRFFKSFGKQLGKTIRSESQVVTFYNVPTHTMYIMIGFRNGCWNGEKGAIYPKQYEKSIQVLTAQTGT